MPAERLSMRKVREVLRLKHTLGMSYRKIGEATGVGKTQVAEYVRRAEASGIGWPVPEGIDDADLDRRLFPPPVEVLKQVEPDWPTVQQELKRRGVTLALLWQEYLAEQPGGYSYTRFCELHGSWRKRISPTMRQTHLAGEKLFVDWAGDTITLTASRSDAMARIGSSARKLAHAGTSSAPRRASILLSRPRERPNEASHRLCPLWWRFRAYHPSPLVSGILLFEVPQSLPRTASS